MCVCVSVSLSHTHTHTHEHRGTHTHTHTQTHHHLFARHQLLDVQRDLLDLFDLLILDFVDIDKLFLLRKYGHLFYYHLVLGCLLVLDLFKYHLVQL
jgi:hypothetical protein